MIRRALGWGLLFCALWLTPGWGWGGEKAGTGPVPKEPVPKEVGAQAAIPGGTVRLGSDDREKGFGYVHGGEAAWRWQWFQGERERVASLAPYSIDLTPVTQGAYEQFVQAAGQRPPFISPEAYRAQGFLVHPYEAVLPYLWRKGKPPDNKREHPVVLVDVADARAYCRWRGRQPDAGDRGSIQTRTCRLPSEDEWELAARGTDHRYFPWGNQWAPYRLNSQEKGPYRTTPVWAYPQGRSPYGLFDMAGNVFEWTSTSGEKGKSILKSCSWDDLGGICRAAARHARPSTSRHILIGFRCACDGKSESAKRKDGQARD